MFPRDSKGDVVDLSRFGFLFSHEGLTQGAATLRPVVGELASPNGQQNLPPVQTAAAVTLPPNREGPKCSSTGE